LVFHTSPTVATADRVLQLDQKSLAVVRRDQVDCEPNVTLRNPITGSAARTGAVGCISRSGLRRLRVGGVGAVTRPVVGSFDEGSNESLLIILHCRPG
jgi:hypothetical protein